MKLRLHPLAVIILFVVAGCSAMYLVAKWASEGRRADLKEQLVGTNALAVKWQVINTMAYFRDERTGLCYANFWTGSYTSDTNIATVPCEKVEKLLYKATVQ